MDLSQFYSQDDDYFDDACEELDYGDYSKPCYDDNYNDGVVVAVWQMVKGWLSDDQRKRVNFTSRKQLGRLIPRPHKLNCLDGENIWNYCAVKRAKKANAAVVKKKNPPTFQENNTCFENAYNTERQRALAICENTQTLAPQRTCATNVDHTPKPKRKSKQNKKKSTSKTRTQATSVVKFRGSETSSSVDPNLRHAASSPSQCGRRSRSRHRSSSKRRSKSRGRSSSKRRSRSRDRSCSKKRSRSRDRSASSNRPKKVKRRDEVPVATDSQISAAIATLVEEHSCLNIGDLIYLCPSKVIQFAKSRTDRTGRYYTSEIRIANGMSGPNGTKVTYKIKTNAPDRYFVKPGIGVLSPGEQIKVNVSLEKNKVDKKDDLSHDQFLILFNPVDYEDEDYDDNMKVFWRAKEKKREHFNYKLDVTLTDLSAPEEVCDQAAPTPVETPTREEIREAGGTIYVSRPSMVSLMRNEFTNYFNVEIRPFLNGILGAPSSLEDISSPLPVDRATHNADHHHHVVFNTNINNEENSGSSDDPTSNVDNSGNRDSESSMVYSHEETQSHSHRISRQSTRESRRESFSQSSNTNVVYCSQDESPSSRQYTEEISQERSNNTQPRGFRGIFASYFRSLFTISTSDSSSFSGCGNEDMDNMICSSDTISTSIDPCSESAESAVACGTGTEPCPEPKSRLGLILFILLVLWIIFCILVAYYFLTRPVPADCPCSPRKCPVLIDHTGTHSWFHSSGRNCPTVFTRRDALVEF